mgnify:CR=1 FL=1
MSVLEWFSLALVCLMGAATPGPSLAIIINHTLSSGLSVGRLASVSHAVAVGIYALGAVLGLATLFQLFPVIAKVIMYSGAAYLSYIGLKLIKSAKITDNLDTKSKNTITTKDGVKDAFLIAFLNPKLAIFFFALFSQFIPTEGADVSMTLILVSTVLIIDLLWYLAVVQTVDKVKHKVNLAPNKLSLMKIIQGTIFIIIAINAVILSN